MASHLYAQIQTEYLIHNYSTRTQIEFLFKLQLNLFNIKMLVIFAKDPLQLIFCRYFLKSIFVVIFQNIYSCIQAIRRRF